MFLGTLRFLFYGAGSLVYKYGSGRSAERPYIDSVITDMILFDISELAKFVFTVSPIFLNFDENLKVYFLSKKFLDVET